MWNNQIEKEEWERKRETWVKEKESIEGKDDEEWRVRMRFLIHAPVNYMETLLTSFFGGSFWSHIHFAILNDRNASGKIAIGDNLELESREEKRKGLALSSSQF